MTNIHGGWSVGACAGHHSQIRRGRTDNHTGWSVLTNIHCGWSIGACAGHHSQTRRGED